MLIPAWTIEDNENRETPNEYKKRKKNEIKTEWTQKQLHGQFIWQTTGKWSEGRWGWLRKECLKRTDEVLIMAVQEQVIRSNNIKTKTEEPRK